MEWNVFCNIMCGINAIFRDRQTTLKWSEVLHKISEMAPAGNRKISVHLRISNSSGLHLETWVRQHTIFVLVRQCLFLYMMRWRRVWMFYEMDSGSMWQVFLLYAFIFFLKKFLQTLNVILTGMLSAEDAVRHARWHVVNLISHLMNSLLMCCVWRTVYISRALTGYGCFILWHWLYVSSPTDNSFINPQLQKIFERVRQSADFMPVWQLNVSDLW